MHGKVWWFCSDIILFLNLEKVKYYCEILYKYNVKKN